MCQCKYEHGSSLSEHALSLRLNKQQFTGIQGHTTLEHRPNAGNMEAHDIMSRNIYSLQQYQEMCELIGLGNKFKFLGVDGYNVEQGLVLLKSIINSLHFSEFN